MTIHDNRMKNSCINNFATFRNGSIMDICARNDDQAPTRRTPIPLDLLSDRAVARRSFLLALGLLPLCIQDTVIYRKSIGADLSNRRAMFTRKIKQTHEW